MNFSASSATRWFSGLLVGLAVVGGLLLWRGHLERRAELSAALATPSPNGVSEETQVAAATEAGATDAESLANAASDDTTSTPAAVAGVQQKPLEKFSEPGGLETGSKEGRAEAPAARSPASGEPGARSAAKRETAAADQGGKSSSGGARGHGRPVLAADRPLELPASSEDGPPPPPGRAYLKTGSIPVERSLLLDGAPVNSFSLDKRVFLPGVHQIRLESAKGCVAFSVELEADETVHLIWDFDMGDWRRNERVSAHGRVTIRPPVSACEDE